MDRRLYKNPDGIEKIIEYPNVFVGFIKVNDFQSPIRIESYNYPKNLDKRFQLYS